MSTTQETALRDAHLPDGWHRFDSQQVELWRNGKRVAWVLRWPDRDGSAIGYHSRYPLSGHFDDQKIKFSCDSSRMFDTEERAKQAVENKLYDAGKTA